MLADATRWQRVGRVDDHGVRVGARGDPCARWGRRGPQARPSTRLRARADRRVRPAAPPGVHDRQRPPGARLPRRHRSRAHADGGTAIRWAGAFEPKIPGTGALFAAALGRIVHGYATSAAAEAERARPRS